MVVRVNGGDGRRSIGGGDEERVIVLVEVDVEVGGGVVAGVVTSPETLEEERSPALIQAWCPA